MINTTAKIFLAGSNIPIVIDKKNLLSMEMKIIDRADIVMPSWGIMSNKGKIKFADFFGDIKEYANKKQLKKGLKIEIYLNNSLYNINKKVGTFSTEKWTYDVNSKEASVDFTDELQQWQDIPIDEVFYTSTTTGATGKQIYEFLYNKTPSKFNMVKFDNLDTNTKTSLNQFSVPVFIFAPQNLWAAWTSLCEVVQGHIFKNNKGDTIFACRD